jgi:hypothetical protein
MTANLPRPPPGGGAFLCHRHLRGGGGNFGVATALEYRLHPVGPMLGGLIIHPLEQAGDLFRFYEAFTREAPDALGSMLLFVTSPDGERWHGLA